MACIALRLAAMARSRAVDRSYKLSDLDRLFAEQRMKDGARAAKVVVTLPAGKDGQDRCCRTRRKACLVWTIDVS
jgi:hypothetical protein